MYFPITIVDNFYSNFDKVKAYANNLEFFKDEQHTMPGLKTKFLNEINPSFFKQSTLKILSLFFLNGNVPYECRTRFEKITPYTPYPGAVYNKEGWIHADDNNRLSGIFFIAGEYEEGTSFFKKKNVGAEISSLNEKHLLLGGHAVEPTIYNKKLKEHNEKYEKILNVPCVPNRLIVFDSSSYHRANGLGTQTEPRLIQTFFFGRINSDFFPIPEKDRV